MVDEEVLQTLRINLPVQLPAVEHLDYFTESQHEVLTMVLSIVEFEKEFNERISQVIPARRLNLLIFRGFGFSGQFKLGHGVECLLP